MQRSKQSKTAVACQSATAFFVLCKTSMRKITHDKILSKLTIEIRLWMLGKIIMFKVLSLIIPIINMIE